MTTTAVSETNFASEVLNSTEPVLVEFWSGWRVMGQVLNELGHQLGQQRVKIASVDLQANPELNKNYRINSLPALVYFVNGKVRGKLIAPASKEAIVATLKANAEQESSAPVVDRSVDKKQDAALRPDMFGLLPWRLDFSRPAGI